MIWNKEMLANNDQLRSETNTGEVFLLARKEKGDSLENGEKVARGYAIYKMIAAGIPEGAPEQAAYVMVMENSLAPSLYNPPILLTEDEVLEFLNSPVKAAKYCYNKWFNCFR